MDLMHAYLEKACLALEAQMLFLKAMNERNARLERRLNTVLLAVLRSGTGIDFPEALARELIAANDADALRKIEKEEGLSNG